MFASVATVAAVRAERVGDNPLTGLAAGRAAVTLTARSPATRAVQGRFGDQVLVRLAVTRSPPRARRSGRASRCSCSATRHWRGVPLGATVEVDGHLAPSTPGDVAAVLSTHDPPTVSRRPGPWWRASARLRAALRESVAGLPPERRALVPALVDGDDAGLDPTLPTTSAPPA